MEDQGNSALFSIGGAKDTNLGEVWLMGQARKKVLKSPFLQVALRQTVFSCKQKLRRKDLDHLLAAGK